jgi:hypothetical protein
VILSKHFLHCKPCLELVERGKWPEPEKGVFLPKGRAGFWLEGRGKIRKKGVSPIHLPEPEKATAGPTKRYPLLSYFPSSF